MLQLMQASFTLYQCVKICYQGCTRDGSSICKSSRLDIIEIAVLGIWSSLFIKRQEHLVKLRVFDIW